MKKPLLSILALTASLTSWSQTQTMINMAVNDMTFDKTHGKVFAIVGSTDSKYGNMLVQIDAKTKIVEKSVFVGSEPDLMDMTSDNGFMYIALAGSPKIVRVNLESFAVDRQVPLGVIGTTTNVFARDIAAIPGNPNQVAVSRREGNTVRDLVIFEGDQLLADSIGANELRSGEIEASADGTKLYTVSSTAQFGRIDLTPAGVALSDKFDGLVKSASGLKMYLKNDLIFTNKGEIINPALSAPIKEATFSGVKTSSQLAFDDNLNQCIFASINGDNKLNIRRYAINTYTFQGSNEFLVNLPTSVRTPQMDEFIYTGPNSYVTTVYESVQPQDNEKFIVFVDNLTTTTGITETGSGSSLSVYPNPTNGTLCVTGLKGDESVTVINHIGQELISASGSTIDISNLADGVYFVKVTSAERTQVLRILKSN